MFELLPGGKPAAQYEGIFTLVATEVMSLCRRKDDNGGAKANG